MRHRERVHKYSSGTLPLLCTLSVAEGLSSGYLLSIVCRQEDVGRWLLRKQRLQ